MIEYKIGIIPDIFNIIEIFKSSGLDRPLNEKDRILKMYKNSNLIISAWDKNKLVGLSRSMTDFYYTCYLSDLAICKKYQNQGIGKSLIKLIQKEIGEETTLILLSSKIGMTFYSKIGMEKIPNGFIIKRKK